MIDVIYIERDIRDHPRTRQVCARFPAARQISCERYGEVFNPKTQNFRLQKRRPALILARKFDAHVLKAPDGFGIGGTRNYYFSHMLNCLYDCRYCFLQGMYRSGHYVLFVNYEDFEQAIERTLALHDGQETWFFSGYDCESLAMEPVTQFTRHFLQFFERHPAACLELRTKSTQVRSLLDRDILSNVVIAFSFTPDAVSRALENRVPALDRRIDAISRLQTAGWQVGLRFDPLIHHQDYQRHYDELFRRLFSRLDAGRLHSVSLGSLRLPRQYHKNIVRLYPDETLFAGNLQENCGMYSYPQDLETEMHTYCTGALSAHIPADILHPCGYATGHKGHA